MAKASRGGDESRHERPRGASVETLLLTDFGFSFDGKLHNHLLGITADKDKWRSGLLAQMWILENTDTHTQNTVRPTATGVKRAWRSGAEKLLFKRWVIPRLQQLRLNQFKNF